MGVNVQSFTIACFLLKMMFFSSGVSTCRTSCIVTRLHAVVNFSFEYREFPAQTVVLLTGVFKSQMQRFYCGTFTERTEILEGLVKITGRNRADAQNFASVLARSRDHGMCCAKDTRLFHILKSAVHNHAQ
jgi:hypothetical protein